MGEDLDITLEFSAGAELLFGNKKKYEVKLCKSEAWSIRSLIAWMKENILTERPDMFIQGDTVRPGILVLVNDTDWELLGELEYELRARDNILFISTLHGGLLALLSIKWRGSLAFVDMAPKPWQMLCFVISQQLFYQRKCPEYLSHICDHFVGCGCFAK